MENLNNPHIIEPRCRELGFPAPYNIEKQWCYVKRLMLCGNSINTRQARYIGIHNLHSIVSKLKKKQCKFMLEHKKCFCPQTKTTPNQLVDFVYMTSEQVILNKEKAAKDNLKATF
ncbi:hypothetical protein [Pseudoalteromonas sp. T1lg24]|uniref:hypothetical protein n=1 Tax=Pseudoalteromonas sp. T1lg24 TaxID=2077099 RepID=UPI000CF70586|nr:hypothetical protein [Pseudoalteromonas sp. T1lg24]